MVQLIKCDCSDSLLTRIGRYAISVPHPVKEHCISRTPKMDMYYEECVCATKMGSPTLVYLLLMYFPWSHREFQAPQVTLIERHRSGSRHQGESRTSRIPEPSCCSTNRQKPLSASLPVGTSVECVPDVCHSSTSEQTIAGLMSVMCSSLMRPRLLQTRYKCSIAASAFQGVGSGLRLIFVI